MGNKQSSNESLLHFNIQRLLQLYSHICDSFDDNLGRLKIYRKKQFNYDYLAFSNKLIQKQSLEDCKNIINLYFNKNQKFINQINNHLKFQIIPNDNLWLKVYSCQVSKDVQNNSNFIPLRICFQYLNFTLKEYIEKNGGGLISPSESEDDTNTIPRNLVYLLGCVLDAYCDLRNLHETHPCLNILSMVISITTPSLIYINVDKCIKFLPIPLFIFSDNFSRLDQCMMQCCKYVNQQHINFRNNIVIPKYGSTNNPSYGIQKIDKLFVNKFKKMVKYIHNETLFLSQNRKSQECSQTNTTHPQQNKNNHHLSLSNYRRQKFIVGRKANKRKNINSNEQQYWDQIDNANNIEELTKLIRNGNQFPQNLDFTLNPDTLLQTSRRNQQNKSQKIKLQQYNKQKNYVNLISRLNSNHQKNKHPRNISWKPTDHNHQELINSKDYSLKNKVSSLTQNKSNSKVSQNSSNKGIKGVISSISHNIPQNYHNTELSQFNSKGKQQSILQASGIKYCRPSQSIQTLEQENRWSRCVGSVEL